MTYSAFMDYREVLVTGGTGFVGTHVCRALIARGHLPRLLVREGAEERIPDDIRSRCRVTLGDVTNRESVENAVQGTSAVVHLVGIIREFPKRAVTFERLHVYATRYVVDAAKRWGVSRFLHMSALGARPEGPTGYFDSKGRAEECVRRSGLDWTVFRPSLIFGPGDRFVGELSRIVRKSPVVPVPGDGEYSLQPVFVGDVVKGIADALDRPDTAQKTFDVGGPERITYNGLLDLIAASIGKKARKMHVPLSVLRPVVRRLERFGRFPLTTDQLVMLLEGNVCDHRPYFSTFGFSPFSLSEYLSGGLGAREVRGEESPGRVRSKATAPDSETGEEARESPEPEAGEPPFRKSA